MAKDKFTGFKVGDKVEYKGKVYIVIALVGSGENVIYGWPFGQVMEGTNRIALKTQQCKLV